MLAQIPPRASSLFAVHPHGFSLSAPLPLPVLIFPFSLHGDSPPRLACIPVAARDLEPASLPPSLLRSPVPAALSPPPGVSPAAASSFQTNRPIGTSILRSDRLSSPGRLSPAPPSTYHSSASLRERLTLPPAESQGPPHLVADPSHLSLPCRGPPCQSLPFVIGLANGQVFSPQIWGGGWGWEGATWAGGWAWGRGGGAPGNPG